MDQTITLGSLFDGVGAFPLAASYFGVKTLWASEILPAATAVTRRHFPDMEHLGDVTKINGATIVPVDIVSFGSPCQDLSIAGAQSGLAGERSGLFREAVRVIKEMRAATNGTHPTFAIWENVRGAYSSNKGEDFRTILEEFAKISDPDVSIPRPAKSKWLNAGGIVGDGYSLAWRTMDSQFWGVPQRRKRIFLVADFAGGRAGEILFEREGLLGDTAQGDEARQGASAAVASGAGGSDRTENGIIIPLNAICAGFIGTASSGAGSIGYREDVAPTLKAEQQTHVVHPAVAGTLCASGAGLSHPAGMASETDLCIVVPESVAFIRQRIDVFREGSIASTQTARQYKDSTDLICDRNAVAAVDCRNLSENGVSGTVQCKSTGGYSLNYQNPVRTGYIVRRFTPLECERLMGLPDGWTEYGLFKKKAGDDESLYEKKQISDSARYSMCGNSIVVNVLEYIMRNIAEALSRAGATLNAGQSF